MSLLEKATLITTPTAHSNGTLHSIKGGAVADFDVVRGSAATRVNAEGLIEDISVLSGELVTNGDFSNGSTGWTISSGASVGENKLDINASAFDFFATQTAIVNGLRYKVTLDAVVSSGEILLYTGVQFASIVSSGTYVFYVTSDSANIRFRSSVSAIVGSISNISVVEVIDATNIPRIDYTTGEGAVLLEPQSTNLIVNSDYLADFSGGATETFDASVLNPEGTYGVARVGDLLASVGDRLEVSLTITPSETYTGSLYYKGEGTNIGKTITVNIKRIGGTYSGSDFKKITLTDNWQRVEATNTFLADNTTAALLVINDSDSADEVLLWGAQFEALPYATSYIPTSGAIATRLADSVTGAGDVNTFNSTEGVLYADISALVNDATRRNITISDGTTLNRVVLRYDNASNRIQGFIQVGGSTNGDMNTVSFSITDNLKIAYKWRANDFALWVNGTEVGTSTNATSFSAGVLTEVNLDRGDGAENFFGKVKALAVFNEALTDAELLCLTTI